MSDLIERLRRYDAQERLGSGLLPPEGLVEEAADEIERLRRLLKLAADRIDTIAWEIPVATSCVPRIMEVTIAMRQEAHRPAVQPAVCPICRGTGGKEASDVYPDGSYSTGRPCPRGCTADNQTPD